MNIQLTVKEILEPLQTVIGVVENRVTLPILAHVLIKLKKGKLTLTTTNMEIELITSIKIQSQETSEFTIYAKDLIDIIRKSTPETIIQFTIEQFKIYIEINNNSFELNTFNTQDFPLLPKITDNQIIKINRLVLDDMIKKTSFSMANQDIRPYLNGLFFEIDKNTITVVATDGHRLSIGKTNQKNDLSSKKTVILPRKTVIQLSKLLVHDDNPEIEIHLSDNYFYLATGNTTITSRLIDGNFPNYEQVIPTNNENIITIDRQNFLNSLQKTSIFVEERTKGVKLAFKDNKVNIFTHSERGQAKAQINVENFNKEMEIAFNIHYLINILETLTTDKINIILPNNENKSFLLNNTNNDNYQYIVMPMKV